MFPIVSNRSACSILGWLDANNGQSSAAEDRMKGTAGTLIVSVENLCHCYVTFQKLPQQRSTPREYAFRHFGIGWHRCLRWFAKRITCARARSSNRKGADVERNGMTGGKRQRKASPAKFISLSPVARLLLYSPPRNPGSFEINPRTLPYRVLLRGISRGRESR